MNKKIYMSLKSRFMSSVPARFLKNKDGLAAIEFVLIAPIMIGMYFGMAELAAAISVDRQVSHSTNVAADLTTQSAVITAPEMADIMAATMLVMNVPERRRGAVKIEIASFGKDSSGDIINKGIATLNPPFPSTFNTTSLKESILNDDSGAVVARVIYDYQALNLIYTPVNIELAETFTLKPRKSDFVDILDESDGTSSNNYSCSYSKDEDEGEGEDEGEEKLTCRKNGTVSS